MPSGYEHGQRLFTINESNVMQVTGLHHFTIRCDAEDLPALEKFYVEVFNLRVGARPALRHPGRWLYGNADQAIVHLNAVGRPTRFDDNSLDHVAFAGSGLQQTRDRLQRLAIPFTEAPLPGIPLHQLFVRDPNGLKLELTFDLSREPQTP